jgi:hypothetical protein
MINNTTNYIFINIKSIFFCNQNKDRGYIRVNEIYKRQGDVMKRSILFLAVVFIFMSVSMISFAYEGDDGGSMDPVVESGSKADGDSIDAVADGSGEGDKDMEEISQKVYAVENKDHTQVLGGKSEKSSDGLEKASQHSRRITKINKPKPEDPGEVAKPGKGKGRGKNKGHERGKGHGKK